MFDAESLLIKFREGKCTDEELAFLEDWYNKFTPASRKTLTDLELSEDVFTIIKALDKKNFAQQNYAGWKKIAVAACFLVALSIAMIFFIRRPGAVNNTIATIPSMLPGGNKAILTLGNGLTINLNDRSNGKLATQGNTQITQVKRGVLTYQTGNSTGKVAVINKITTPAGGQYHLILEDGTQVFLNASSSITFPTSFIGRKRVVKITGEAYFEVAHNVQMPFEVESMGQTIKVLGTHFNVNAYSDEPSIKTTLLQGSVMISSNGGSNLLKPGQQASVSKTGIMIASADVDQVVGWKNGDFVFNNEDLHTIMRQVARWYDVDVIYKGTGNGRRFFGTISRSKKLVEILAALEMNQNVHFKTEGRTIEVMP